MTLINFVRDQELINKIDPELIFRKAFINYSDDPIYRSKITRPVYLVENEGQKYILKMGYKHYDWSKEHINVEKIILQEIKNMGKFPKLVKDYGEIGDYVAILKEFIEGEELSKRNSPLTNKQLEVQLKETVEYLHKMGYVHIDIRPANIIVGPHESYAKLIDLGFCYLQKDLSPEKFNFWRELDLKCLNGLLAELDRLN